MKMVFTVVLLMMSVVAGAQVVPDNLMVYLKWTANDASEGIERYRVEWNDGGQRWINLGDAITPADSNDVRFSTKVAWMKNTIMVGQTVCFRVTAVRGTEESDASENACGEIQPASAADPTNALTKPATPVVEFVYE